MRDLHFLYDLHTHTRHACQARFEKGLATHFRGTLPRTCEGVRVEFRQKPRAATSSQRSHPGRLDIEAIARDALRHAHRQDLGRVSRQAETSGRGGPEFYTVTRALGSELSSDPAQCGASKGRPPWASGRWSERARATMDQNDPTLKQSRPLRPTLATRSWPNLGLCWPSWACVPTHWVCQSGVGHSRRPWNYKLEASAHVVPALAQSPGQR